jgi:alpha-glucosidase (family GH31 glycosyl hydrolase)
VDNTFSTLAAQVPLGLNTGVSGVPYWGTDIGGFFHPAPETGELFARWFQFGAFCPVFRSHGQVWREHLPWAHGEEVERICRTYAELRYRLMPYTYTLAQQAAEAGLPLMRPLWLNYPDDPRTWDLGSEYLWGDDLLIAPVTREGARRWAVYLPGGAWLDFWTWRRHAGGAAVEVEAPLERMPIFVREGAVIPMAPVAQYDGEFPWRALEILVCPAAGESVFELYEDDGRTNAYRRGRFAVTKFWYLREGHDHLVEIEEPGGEPSLVPRDRRYVIRMPYDGPEPRLSVEGGGDLPLLEPGRRGEGAGWWLEGDFLMVRPRERAFRIRVRPGA